MAARDAPKSAIPSSLKTDNIADAELLSLIAKEKGCTQQLEKVRADLREVMRDRDTALRAVDNNRESFSRGSDEFQTLVDRKQALRSKMDQLQLDQSKMSDSRNELQLIGFEIKPIEAEISELVAKIDEAARGESALNTQRSDLMKECGGFQSVTDADEQLSKIEAQLENAKKAGQTSTLTSLTRQKTAAEKAKKNVMASYALDERIIKEGKRQLALKKALESKEGQLKSLTTHRQALRDKLDSQKSIDDDFKKIKAEINDINKKLDTIQAKKKERVAEVDAPANAAKATVAKLQAQQREMLALRDALSAELTEISKIVENKFVREVKYNPQYRRHLIGRNGATMDTLMQDFGVALYLDGPGRDAGIAFVYGPADACEACATAISKIVEEAEASDKTETIPFNPSLTKIVIGARGATIDKLQSTSGAQINVDGDKIHINGTLEAIDAAKALINELFAGNAQEELAFDLGAFELIIGRGGSVIRQIEKDSGVKSIRADRDRGVLTISGHRDNVSKAMAMYQDIIQQAKNKVTFMISDRMVSAVIGPQGKIIRELQEQTGAVINVQNKGKDAAVTIRGSADAVREARRRIEDIALREEIKVPFDPTMAAYLSARPMEKGENGEDVEKLSPVEAIRLQCECDQVSVLRAEGKIVIRGRPEAVSKAKQLLAKFLQANAPKTLRLPIPAVIITHILKRQEGGSIFDRFRQAHAANILNVDFDRTAKMATLIGQPNASIGAINSAAQDLDAIIRGCKFTIVPVPPHRCGAVIGAGGKVIADLQSTTNTIVNVDRDAGEVSIFSPSGNEADVEKAATLVTAIREAPPAKQF